MIHRVLESIFRHPIQLLLLMALPPIIGFGLSYRTSRSYQSTATLWALHRYEIITGAGPQSNTLATPAQTQVGALSELLQSRSFAVAVEHTVTLAVPGLNLDSSILSNSQSRDDAWFGEISHHVVVTTDGDNSFVISYTNHNPLVAQQLVKAVISNYGLQVQAFSTATGQSLLKSYQKQFTQVKSEADAASAAEAQYIADHPHLSQNDLFTDPQYTLLHAQTVQAQTTLLNIQDAIDTINQQIFAQSAGGEGYFTVLDPPLVPEYPLSRLSTLIIGSGLGLAIALIACVLYIVILLRRDRTIRSASDLEKLTELPLAMQLPRLTSTRMLFSAIEIDNHKA